MRNPSSPLDLHWHLRGREVEHLTPHLSPLTLPWGWPCHHWEMAKVLTHCSSSSDTCSKCSRRGTQVGEEVQAPWVASAGTTLLSGRDEIWAPYPISSGICLLRVWAALVLSLHGGSLTSPFSLYWHECRWGHRLSVASARVEQLLSVSFLPCEAAPFPVLSQRAGFWFGLLPVGVCCQFLQLQLWDLWSKREKPQELTPE